MIENEILKLFPDPILKYKLDDCKNLNKDLEKYIYQLYEGDTKGVERSNRGGWHSKNFDLSKQNSIQKKFATKVQDYILNFFQQRQIMTYLSNVHFHLFLAITNWTFSD